MNSILYTSFVIRLWRQQVPLGDAITAGWRSEVENIQSGKSWVFSTLDELEAFFRQQAERSEGLVRIDSSEACQENGYHYD